VTLKPRWFHILLALSEDSAHGSGIVRLVLQQTNGTMRLWPAMLYGTLEKLVELGLISELEQSPDGESGKRRYYQITDTGRQELKDEAEHLAQLASMVRTRIG
jgi:DNA-binding PadR family transcriptional regulator